jgi:hypothetical protein
LSSPSATNAPRLNPYADINQIARGYAPAACLWAAAKLDVAELLAGGPTPVSELARATHTEENALYRILRALASINVFRETVPRTFENTPLSEAMRSGIARSARDEILFEADPLHMNTYAELMHSIETGGTAFKKVTGTEPFEFFRQHSEENDAFNAAMTAITARSVNPLVQSYDFGESGTLADIGGGHGELLTMILQKHRGLRGIVFDLPHVVEGARPRIAEAGLASRCDIVGGDFFQSLPPADSYVMKSIVHDWDDERATKILKNCAAALRGTAGKVLLIGFVIVPGNEPDMAKWLDIEMLAMAGGRERTEVEHAALFSKAGLKLARVVRTPSPACVIEAVKA